MSLTEPALKKMSKDGIITLALDYQDKLNLTLANINKDIGESKYKFQKLVSELALSKSVNTNLCKKRKTLERQHWADTNIVDNNG